MVDGLYPKSFSYSCPVQNTYVLGPVGSYLMKRYFKHVYKMGDI